ncbi:hypothetical protein NE237_010380 [Protea cynaroides]|uniref:Ubiquitin thioesterase OTU n=1 Tax=Protea cynaroides TaxID=273540 RepID=A0A9Q0R157_9MAGN|nr:hypothetical protein NE237_010380 [Protea cynaroides]
MNVVLTSLVERMSKDISFLTSERIWRRRRRGKRTTCNSRLRAQICLSEGIGEKWEEEAELCNSFSGSKSSHEMGYQRAAYTSCCVNMTSCSPVTTCTKHIVHLSGYAGKQNAHVCAMVSQSQSNTCCFHFHACHSRPRYAGLTTSGNFCSKALKKNCFSSGFSKLRRNWHSLTIKSSANSTGQQMTCVGISLLSKNINLRLLVPRQDMLAKVKWNFRPTPLRHVGAFAGLIFGLSVCFSSFNPVYAAEAKGKEDHEDDCESSMTTSSHGKKVYTVYSITGIPGDGRCLFRSVAHGACLRSGKPSPGQSLQRELADELRGRVADEFVKRREETEWFVEGDFDTYVSQIRKPHVWGGEPELFMASHVLQMPITVYMYNEDAGGLIAIAEYGQEYGKGDPIRVLYHGFGHYDALQIPVK